MTIQRRALSVLLLTIWSVLLTALTGVLGAVPLRGLRLFAGPVAYWFLVLGIAAGLMAAGWSLLAMGYLALAVMLGLFSELEERLHSMVSSAFSAVLLTALVIAGSFILWVSRYGTGWYSLLLSKVETLISALPAWNQAVNIEAKDILLQMPSAVIILLALGLFFGLLFQRRMLALLGFRHVRQYRLSKFVVPESFIWVFLVGLAGTILKVDTPWAAAVSANLLNVCIVVFFLQGLAVIGQYLASFKMSPIWQTLLMVLLVSQLFILVSLVGLADYWLNFRQRLAKRAEQIDKNI